MSAVSPKVKQRFGLTPARVAIGSAEALISAMASLPATRPSASLLLWVTIAISFAPPERVNSTSSVTCARGYRAHRGGELITC